MIKITGLFRLVDTAHDERHGPSKKNPGGGVARKAQQLQKALPNLNFIDSLDNLGNVTIVEPLWFLDFENLSENKVMRRIEEYTEADTYKILWVSDAEFLRWRGVERENIFDATDVIAANSPYMRNIMRLFSDRVTLLTDPVDTDMIKPEKTRDPVLYANSQVILEKGIDSIAKTFALFDGDDVETLFIGSPFTWGLSPRENTSSHLDKLLNDACDQRLRSATFEEVGAVASTASAFLSLARYESFGYSMIEAMLGGCEVFCNEHLAYANRPVTIVSTPEDAYKKIKAHFNIKDPEYVNLEARQYVIDHYSLDVFRDQLREIIGGTLGV